MKRTSIQSFAAGILFATIILYGTYTFFDVEHRVNQDPAVTEAAVEKYLKDNHKVMVDQTDYEALLEEKETNRTGQEEKENNPIEEDEKQTHPLEIIKGTTLYDISRELETEGIVESSTEFEHYMIDNGYDRSIQLGTFELSETMGLKEIAETITN